LTTSPFTHGTEERLSRIRERLASTSASPQDQQLRVMLVLTHEALRQREVARQAIASTAWEGRGAPAPAAAVPMAADGYAALVAAVHETVGRVIPQGSRILVLSKGDDELLVPGYDALHFPQGPGGIYAGHYPADSEAAVAHLEQCRAAGAEFLVVPKTGYWWLDYYGGLAQHLLVNARVLNHDERCAIFDLRHQSEEGAHR
jgi:hypothetical protein